MRKLLILTLLVILSISFVQANEEWYYPLSNYTGYPGPTFPGGVGLSFEPGLVGMALRGGNTYSQRSVITTGSPYTFNQFYATWWMKPDDVGSGEKIFWLRDNDDAVPRMLITYSGSSGNIEFCNYISGWTCFSSTGVPVGNWTLVSFVLDGEYAHIYVNGEELVSPNSFSGVYDFSNMQVSIMGWLTGTSEDSPFNYDGFMDELRIGFNESLTPSEILTIYEEQFPPPPIIEEQIEESNNIGGAIAVAHNMNQITKLKKEEVNPLIQFILNLRAAILRIVGIE